MSTFRLLSFFNNRPAVPRHIRRARPALTMAWGFLGIILIGSILLALPIAARRGEALPYSTALFTSVSATCVTGLVVVDTAQSFSTFGCVVILLLFQVGGLGFMSITTIFYFVMRRKINLTQRVLLVQSLSLHDIKGVVRLIRHVLLGTMISESCGALILWTHFVPRFGLGKALWLAVFHSVSAFTNSGFDLMGANDAFAGFVGYERDPVVLVTLMVLTFVGGLGFFVWEDIYNNRSFKRLQLHTKLVLSITLFLVLVGWLLIFVAERNNPATMGTMTLPQALLASLFQAIMPRSGGLALYNQDSLTGISKLIVMLLMFVGGSAGSAAGGIKNVTAGVIVFSSINTIRGKTSLSLFGRTVPAIQIKGAVSLAVLVVMTLIIAIITISFLQPELTLTSVLFETVSATTNCGLSNGLTSILDLPALCVLMLCMVAGRVGITVYGMSAFLRRNTVEDYKHPDAWIMMG